MTMQHTLELALQHYSNGRWQDTEGLCRHILNTEPEHDGALHLLGVIAHRSGHHDAAIELIRRAILNAPATAEYHSNLAAILAARGQPRAAAEACRRAIALNPLLAEVHFNLGNALRETGARDAAAAAYRRAIDLRFDYPDAHNNLGTLMREMGLLDEAIAELRQAVALRPDYAHACSNLAIALRDLGRADEAIEADRRAVELAPSRAEIRSNLILALHYPEGANASAILDECRRWNAIHAERLQHFVARFSNDRQAERALRLGFVSPDLRMHSVAFFLAPLLENLDRARVHVTCYSTNAHADAVTARLQAASDAWVSLVGLSDDAAAQRIRDDRIDILIDLSGHTAGNRLLVFARKPAPIQINYLGLTSTTGLGAIDYRLTDWLVDPAGAEALGTERLLRLPETAWCFEALSGQPAVAPAPASINGFVTFGSFNNLAKVNRAVLDAWARILEAAPTSRLIQKSVAFRSADAIERFRDAFAQRGIAPERIDALPDTSSQLDHLRLYDRVDVALDTFPYPGTTTTCEAMWMGVPVITLAGTFHGARVGVSLLTHAGLPECIGTSIDDYVRRALQLTADGERLASLRVSMRDRLHQSPLMDAPRFARHFEAACRDAWRAWCSSNLR